MLQSGKNITSYVYFVKIIKDFTAKEKGRHRMHIVDFSAKVAYQIWYCRLYDVNKLNYIICSKHF